MTTEEVVERLLETVGGQIVACNVVAGVQSGLVDAAWATGVLAWMGKLGGHEDYAAPRSSSKHWTISRWADFHQPHRLRTRQMSGWAAPMHPFRSRWKCPAPYRLGGWAP